MGIKMILHMNPLTLFASTLTYKLHSNSDLLKQTSRNTIERCEIYFAFSYKHKVLKFELCVNLIDWHH